MSDVVDLPSMRRCAKCKAPLEPEFVSKDGMCPVCSLWTLPSTPVTPGPHLRVIEGGAEKRRE